MLTGHRIAIPLLLCVVRFSSALPADPLAPVNLLANPGFEEAESAGLPTAWEPLVLGAPAQFSLDREVKHAGSCSLRLDAAEITRAYIHSETIPVAPGDKLTIGAWVKSLNVPADKGTIIIIASFTRGASRAGEVAKVAVADRRPGWQRIEGTVSVPSTATGLRLRLGFSYSMGSLWWDDVVVHAANSLAAYVDLPQDRFYALGKAVPVVMLNRERIKRTVCVRLHLDGEATSRTVDLTGEATQTAKVPATLEHRGKRTLTLDLEADPQGPVLFSSGEIRVTLPPPLVLRPLIPTHGVIEEGDPAFDGEAEIAIDDTTQGSLVIQVLDANGKSRAAWSKDLREIGQADLVPFAIHTPRLEPGSYRVTAEVKRPQGKPITAEQPWSVIPRRLARVTINQAGFPEVAGRAFFPLGMFNNGARLAESAAAGINTMHAYNAARVQAGRRPDDQRLKNVLDQAEQAQVRYLLLVPMEFAMAGDWDAFTRRIRMFRNHPGLLAWDEEEGLARGSMKIETLQRIRQILQQEDPHHPFMVGDAHDVIGRITDRRRLFPADLMDMGMWWWYPFPLKPGKGNDLQGEQPANSLLLEPPLFLTGGATNKPIWVGIQAYKKTDRDARYPSPAEYRVQAYLALIHGAKGLIWYGGSVTGGLFLAPDEGHWPDLKKLISELRDLSPVLMAPATELVTVLPKEAPVDAVLKQTPQRRVLLAANRGTSDCRAEFMIPNLPAGSVRVLNEDRTVTATPGQLRDEFKPYAVHVYELTAEAR